MIFFPTFPVMRIRLNNSLHFSNENLDVKDCLIVLKLISQGKILMALHNRLHFVHAKCNFLFFSFYLGVKYDLNISAMAL